MTEGTRNALYSMSFRHGFTMLRLDISPRVPLTVFDKLPVPFLCPFSRHLPHCLSGESTIWLLVWTLAA